jgi:hypothetical protein
MSRDKYYHHPMPEKLRLGPARAYVLGQSRVLMRPPERTADLIKKY